MILSTTTTYTKFNNNLLNEAIAQPNEVLGLLSEEDLNFLKENGYELSEFTDEHIREIKQPTPEAQEERIKQCIEMKEANFIDNNIDCINWMLTLEGNQKLVEWGIKKYFR